MINPESKVRDLQNCSGICELWKLWSARRFIYYLTIWGLLDLRGPWGSHMAIRMASSAVKASTGWKHQLLLISIFVIIYCKDHLLYTKSFIIYYFLTILTESKRFVIGKFRHEPHNSWKHKTLAKVTNLLPLALYIYVKRV